MRGPGPAPARVLAQWSPAAALVLLALLRAATAADGDAAAAGAAAPAPPPTVTTTHRLDLATGTLAYTARAGVLPIQPDPEKPAAEMFYVAYTEDDAAADGRPVTFLFNGGPGAASVYLHLGGIGPRRLAVNPDGSWPPPPVDLVDNPLTWLAFTDLVFIDPVGTGYSRVPAAAGDEDEEEKEDARRGGDRDYWGVGRDLDSLGAFMRLWLTRNGRWLSPKVIAGESYGGFRVAALAETLPDDFDIAPNGLILISPLMEYAMLDRNDFNLLPWALTVPSLAATAAHHGRGALADEVARGDLAAALAPVERFAVADMLVGLAGEGSDAFHAELAALIGLPAELVARRRGRVPVELFAKRLLREQERLVGRYDGTLSGPDPHPESDDYEGGDPSFELLTTAYAPAILAYLRDGLGYRTDATYELLNREVGREWDFEQRRQGFAGFSASLRAGLILNPGLEVLIAHGYHDLITPYFASHYLVTQMDLPATARERVQLADFHGGHMFYLHAASLAAFHASAGEFYADLAR
jgi:carboxypeptidase C (cathepsin A)